MADNPKSLASLADECAKASYETYDDGQDDYSDLFRRAAAALRAPTIAADGVVVTRLREIARFLYAMDTPNATAASVELTEYAHCVEAAFATPSPTIAATKEKAKELRMSDTLQPGDRILDPTIGLVEDKDGNITSRMERPLDPPLPHGYDIYDALERYD